MRSLSRSIAKKRKREEIKRVQPPALPKAPQGANPAAEQPRPVAPRPAAPMRAERAMPPAQPTAQPVGQHATQPQPRAETRAPMQRPTEQPQPTPAPQEPPNIQPVQAQDLDGLIDKTDPRDGAHLALRTVKKQGPGFGNVQPLGTIDTKKSKRLFGQKAAEKLPKRDPAPSRARYRMQRLWLTPMVHSALRVGLPSLVIGAAALFFLSDETTRNNVSAKLAETRESFQARPEFRVELFKINGVNASIGEKVRAAADLKLPMTSFDLELEDIRKKIESLDEVQAASLFLRTGGILDADIVPREPVVLLRTSEGLQLLDNTGILAGTLAKRELRPDLPVLAGEGAEGAIDEALSILATAGPIKDRLRGLQRVGERRWDLVLDRDMVIKLPTDAPVPAVERAVALHQAQNLLDRDIISLDLRDGARPFVQLSGEAMHRMKLLKHLPIEETSSQ